MRKSRSSEEQIVGLLKEAGVGSRWVAPATWLGLREEFFEKLGCDASCCPPHQSFSLILVYICAY